MSDTQISENGIEVEGLVRDFKGGVRAVDGIDLQVAPGEIYGFLGPTARASRRRCWC
jgi:ABC-type multidrug transport system ATPase subunit